ncbi:hypothetical protein [Leptolyngbya sp. BC1307]|uniref:hypothetical protein n=1 Tax=Leptolyngbya sp. BC1307 TaxID=2029589 RepID=UPI000EFD24D4|nr:hypothetical protein [Leptolyngbya sp. BC1307]
MPFTKFPLATESFYKFTCLFGDRVLTGRLIALLLVTGSAGLMAAPKAIAQMAPDVGTTRNPDGSVRVDSNSFNIQTGPLTNQSNIPLPSELPLETRERQPLPVEAGKLAPNSIEISPDVPYINRALNDALSTDTEVSRYTLQDETLQLTSRFDLRYSSGNHSFGEGIRVTVFGPEGQVKSRDTVFVRGDDTTRGPGDTLLPSAAGITAVYGANDMVELRVLNLRGNGADPTESGIYFTQGGDFIVEDLPDGGDLDFDDGDYVRLPGGRGQVLALRDDTNITVTTQVEEIPLDPEIRQEEIIETDEVEGFEQTVTVVEEETIRGSVELPDTAVSTRIGHATGVRTDDDEQLVYNRYTSAGQIRIGSDGLGATGQLSPLNRNPSAPPTLLTGNITFNPTVGDNEAGLTATAGITQFFNSTHRLATDVLGNALVTPDPDGPLLVEPAGLFNNRRWVGYVPSTPTQTVQGDPLLPVNGVIDLPESQAVVIEPADPQAVGAGDAAYTDNVGGLLLERPDGTLSFVPQWTKNGYTQEPISLAAGEVDRVIYALVPQQAGQALQIGQTYDVTRGASGHRITDGNFTIISADRQLQNFVQEMAEVYAVEDTLPETNAATAQFSGVQGVYEQVPGGDPIPTVDVNRPAEVDARVGNILLPQEIIAGAVGQLGYARVTRAGGLYVGSALTGGIGNQRDTIRRTATTTEQVVAGLLVTRTVNTFSTPLVQVNTTGIETTETSQTTGRATFNINSDGELNDVAFQPLSTVSTGTSSRALTPTTSIRRGDEVFLGTFTDEFIEQTEADLIAMDQEGTTVESDSYPNFSPVRGELTLGGVYNFGNTPWTAAANTVRAELFTRDTVFGRGSGNETGLRAEVVFHPFGEVRRDAYQYDSAGNVVAVYQTESVVDASGDQVMALLTGANDKSVEVPVNQFALDEAGDRLIQRVGTGRAQGPGVYLRLEDVLSDSDSLIVAGGLQFSF